MRNSCGNILRCSESRFVGSREWGSLVCPHVLDMVDSRGPSRNKGWGLIVWVSICGGQLTRISGVLQHPKACDRAMWWRVSLSHINSWNQRHWLWSSWSKFGDVAREINLWIQHWAKWTTRKVELCSLFGSHVYCLRDKMMCNWAKSLASRLSSSISCYIAVNFSFLSQGPQIAELHSYSKQTWDLMKLVCKSNCFQLRCLFWVIELWAEAKFPSHEVSVRINWSACGLSSIG